MAGSGLVGRMRVALGLDDAQFKKGLNDNAGKMRQFGKRLAVVGAGLSAAGAGIAAGLRAQLSAADDMGKLAQKIGIPVDDLSRLQHAADMSGVSMGSLQGAVARLSRAIADKPDKFKKIGVALRGADGQLRRTTDVMADVAQVLSEMPDGAKKTALAMEFLGKSGADLIPMLNGGRDALRAMMDEADDLGIVITPEMAKNAEQFNDNLSRLQKQMHGIWVMVTANLAPSLNRLSAFVVDVASRFRGMSPAMQSFLSTLAASIMVLGPVLSGLGLMIMTAGPFVAAMMKAAAGVKALSVALVANPIGAAVAVIAGAAYLIYDNWEDVGPWFGRLWDGIRATFDGFVDFFRGVFTGDVTGAFDGLKAVGDGFLAYYGTLWDGIVGVITFAWEKGIKPVTDALGMTDQIINGWNNVRAAFDTVMSGISSAFSAAWSVIEPIYTALKWVWDNAAELGGKISSLSSGAAQADGNNRAGNGRIDLAPIGRDVAAGLAQGSAAIADQGAADGGGYIAGFARALGIRSPSRVMMEFGRFMSEGLGLGVAAGQPLVQSASERVGQSMADSIMPYMDGLIRRTTTLKEAFRDMLSDMASQLMRSGLSRLFGSIAGAFFGGDPLAAALQGAGLNAIPALADGGRIVRAGIFQINEAGGEARRLESGDVVFPHSLSREMARGVTGRNGPGGAQDIRIGFDDVGGIRAVVRNEAGAVLAEAESSIIVRSVAASGSAMRQTKSFGNR